MRQFKAIFIRYFIVIFLILLVIASLVTLNEQGKIDLQFSLPLSLLLAALGAVLATFFIGGFRQLDAKPPHVQPSEYLPVDVINLNRQLEKIRFLRKLSWAMFFALLPVGLFIILFNLPIFLVLAYMPVLIFVEYHLMFTECPRCGNYFHFRKTKNGIFGNLDAGSKKLNLLFAPGYSNWITNKCLNCGLDIKGKSNI